MPRFFVDESQIKDDEILITGSDVNHICNVLRMEISENVTVSDGKGMDYYCSIAELSKKEVRLDIIDRWSSFAELPARIYLFQGLPKADKMELIIQKAVELGAYAVIPVVTRRSVVKLDASRAAKKIARWQSIAESAAKQAGRGIIPEIGQCISFDKALDMACKLDSVLIPYEKAQGIEASRELIRGLLGRESIGVFIGPEGGFDESEIVKAIEAGAHTMTLGKRILRTETAGLAVLSILMFELEDSIVR